MRKIRFSKNNKNYRTYNNRFKRFILSQLNKLIIAITILLILLLLKFINLNFTNNVIQIIHRGINYEFNIKESGETLKKYGVRIINIPEKIISVFTSENSFEKFQTPIKGAIYKPFGEIRTSDDKTVFNNGIDIIPNKGEGEVITVSSGKVLKIEDKNSSGFTIVIDYDNYKFIYDHLIEVYVEKGDEVKEGQKIGTLGGGKDGNKYLHFEVWENDKPIDPETIINIDIKYN